MADLAYLTKFGPIRYEIEFNQYNEIKYIINIIAYKRTKAYNVVPNVYFFIFFSVIQDFDDNWNDIIYFD